jgi:hypothetical protein
MILTDKNIKRLVKKIQNRCAKKYKSPHFETNSSDLRTEELEPESEIFAEMKKRPYSE